MCVPSPGRIVPIAFYKEEIGEIVCELQVRNELMTSFPGSDLQES